MDIWDKHNRCNLCKRKKNGSKPKFDHAEAREMWRNGVSQVEIAKKMGVSTSAIGYVINGRKT